MPYLLGLFHWGPCRVSKLEAMSKRKSFKIDQIVWEMHAMSSFGLSFCECMHYARVPTAHSLRRNPPILLEDFGAMNGQWVRVHTLTQQGSTLTKVAEVVATGTEEP